MKSFKEFLMEQEKPGTYAAVKPDSLATDKINKVLKDMKVPEPEQNLHVTLLYSRKNLPNFKPNGFGVYVAKPKKIEVWPTKSGKNCLVLTLDCPSLVERHKYLMKKHQATYDYTEYKTHMSLSYDIGDYDINNLSISDFPTTLLLTHEYTEELDTKGK